MSENKKKLSALMRSIENHHAQIKHFRQYDHLKKHVEKYATTEDEREGIAIALEKDLFHK